MVAEQNKYGLCAEQRRSQPNGRREIAS